jgi:hypothetical protein
MTYPSQEPEEPRPQTVVRIILPGEVCTNPEAAAILHEEIRKALKSLRDGSDSSPDAPRVWEGRQGAT